MQTMFINYSTIEKIVQCFNNKMFQCFQQYFNTLALLDIGRVCQTLYTDIVMQMQNALEKLVLGLVFELDDRLELKC